MLVGYNFPAYTLLFSKEAFWGKLFETYKKLANVELDDVRWVIAAGFHEVLRTFETPEEKADFGLDIMFVRFMNDESHYVNGAMVKNF